MKICVLTHTFPRNKNDVAAAFMKEFCDGLVENGNHVVVVTPFDQQFKRQGDPFQIVTFKYIWPNNFHLLGYSKTMEGDLKLRKRAYLLLPFLLLFSFLTLYRVVKKEKIDIISVHWILPNGLVAFLVSKITGIPYVITLPGTDAYLAYRYKIFGWVAKIIAQSSSGIISNSSWHLNRILNLGIKEKPSSVINYPADISKFRPSIKKVDQYRTKLNLNKQNLIILAVGRLVYKKGFGYLIKAMSKVLQTFPQAHLIIGGEGDLKKDLEDTVKKLKLEKSVSLVGTIPRDEIIYFYNLADIMVAPSIVDKNGNVDGGPVVSMESMACGKPQIVTSVLGVADLLKNKVNGFIVPEKSVDALTEAINKLAASAIMREKMGKNNRSLVVHQLSTKYIGQEYSLFFQKALNKNVY